jgi:hypothetical protein
MSVLLVRANPAIDSPARIAIPTENSEHSFREMMLNNPAIKMPLNLDTMLPPAALDMVKSKERGNSFTTANTEIAAVCSKAQVSVSLATNLRTSVLGLAMT